MKEIISIKDIKPNPLNPRLIKDSNFKRLVQSIKDFPEMLEIRPIVVNKDMIILGGNMRYKASVDAGLKKIPVIIADLTEIQQKEFIIRDNVSGGIWDWDILANEWSSENLKEWGLDVWDDIDGTEEFQYLDEDEDEDENENKSDGNAIVLIYTDNDYQKVIKAFEKYTGTKEQIIFNLLKS